MTTGETKPGWSALAKGAAGAAVRGIAGFLGTVFTNVLSAPKDSVAYDLIQSATGMLRKDPAPPAASEAPKAEAPRVAPEAAEKIAGITPAPSTPAVPTKPPASEAPKPAAVANPTLVAPTPAPPKPAEPAPQVAAAPAADAPAPAPTEAAPGSMVDRVRQTTELAKKAAAAAAALGASRILTLNDGSQASICGASYRVDVTSITSGQGAVALGGTGAEPIPLAVGAPREISTGCRIELLSAAEDLTTRRAQMRETKTR